MLKNKVSLLAYVSIAGLVVVLTYPALEWLVRSWLNNPYYAHGFLIPPIAALLAWRQWRRVITQPRQSGTSIGILITVASLAAIVWAMRWHNYLGVSLALVALLCGILLYLEGWERLKYWFFPLLFLLFMVPLPFVDLASPWLESFTAQTATGLVRLIGISAVQQGGEITLPNTTITVGAPCSGLRSLVTMVTIGVAWVYMVEGRLFAKALMLLAVLPLVAFSNVLRIAILLGVAATLGEEAALSYYHDWSSPILFLLALALMLLIGSLLGCSRVRDDIF